jgi:predicted lipoprotein
MPSKVIGNKNILAAVELDRKSSPDLIEKTNREGFTENDAYTEFKKAIEQVLELLTHERNIDKELIREFYEGAIRNEPVNAEIDALEELVNEKFEEDIE